MIGLVDQLRREWKLEKIRRESLGIAGPDQLFSTLFRWSIESIDLAKREKLHKLFTKKSTKMERTLTG